MTDASVRRIHIDLGEMARAATPPAGVNLVTRPTGRAVRGAIETKLAGVRRAAVTVDFSRVSILDFSCADEVVAKLLLRHLDQAHRAAPTSFFACWTRCAATPYPRRWPAIA